MEYKGKGYYIITDNMGSRRRTCKFCGGMGIVPLDKVYSPPPDSTFIRNTANRINTPDSWTNKEYQ